MPKVEKLTRSSPFPKLVDGWLHNLGTTKPAANTTDAYRRDLQGVARRIADGTDIAVLRIEDLTKEALQAAFASWAAITPSWPRPTAQVLNWLRQGAGAPILAQLAAGTMAISHEALDAEPRRRAANHIRQMLIARGVLAARDEQLATLERLNTATVASIERPEDRNTVADFATWRGLRRRAEHNPAQRTAVNHACNQVLGAAAFLDWFAAHQMTLAAASQGDLELRLATGAPSRYDARHFIDWTSQRKLTAKLKVPPLRS